MIRTAKGRRMFLEDFDENSYPEIIEEYFGGEFDKDDRFYFTKVFKNQLFLSFSDLCKMVR